MGAKYQYNADSSKSAMARADHVRVHYKNTVEVSNAIRGMDLNKAKKYLHQVLAHKDAVPFRKFIGGLSRHSQAKVHKANVCKWPTKSVYAVLKIIQNAEANAKNKKLNVADLKVAQCFVNQAPQIRRRTHRAHGRINAYMTSPCHIQVVLTAKGEVVAEAGAVATVEDVPPLE